VSSVTGAHAPLGAARGEAAASGGARLVSDVGGVRTWQTVVTIQCEAERHDTVSAYKNHHCRCPRATARAVDYERRRQAGQVAPSQPAEMTARRLQALAVLGWGSPDIAAMIGRNPVSVSEIRRGSHSMVTGKTAARVFRVYRQLHRTPGPSPRTRAYASRKGWAGPSLLLFYGDVDEVAVARAVRGERVELKRNERLTAVQLLHRAGSTYEDTARRLAVSMRQVHRDLADLGLINQEREGVA
jgi:hypothetical protein